MKNKQFKIMFSKKTISDEEINSFKNFDNLLEAKQNIDRRNTIYQYTSLVFLFIAGFSLVFFLSKGSLSGEENDATIKNVEKLHTLPLQENISAEILENHSKQEIQPAPVEQDVYIKNEQKHQKEEMKVAKADEKNLPRKEKPVESASDEFIEAHPAIGYEALFAYFERELKYPAEALEEKAEGTVLTEFTISKEGKIENLKIIRGISPEIDREALRLISEMPSWVPASLGPEKYASKLTLPLTFHIEKTDHQKE